MGNVERRENIKTHEEIAKLNVKVCMSQLSVLDHHPMVVLISVVEDENGSADVQLQSNIPVEMTKMLLKDLERQI